MSADLINSFFESELYRHFSRDDRELLLDRLQKELYSSLKSSEEGNRKAKYRNIFAHIPLPVMVTHSKGKLVEINQLGAEVLGYNSPEEAKAAITNLEHDLYVNPDKRWQFLNELLISGVVEKFECEIFLKNRTTTWVTFTGKLNQKLSDEDFTVEIYIRNIAGEIKREEQIRFQALILENIDDAVIATDLAGRVTYFNHGAEKIFGYSASEMMGNTLEILYPNETRENFKQEFASIAGGNSFAGEWLGMRKDGKKVRVHITSGIMYNLQGKPLGMLGVSKDLTLLHETRQQLQEKEELQEAVLEAIPDFLIYLDSRGTIKYLNENETVFGMQASYLIGKNLDSIFPREVNELFQGKIIHTLHSGKISSFEYQLESEGKQLIFECRLSRASVDSVVSLNRDITFEKYKEEMIRESEEKFRKLVEQSVDGIMIRSCFTN